MSEEQTEQSTQLVNNELTERVNNAYIASNYTLLNGGTDNVVLIKGDRGEDDNKQSADIMLTLEGMEEVSKTLREEVDNKKPEAKDEQ